MSKYNYDLDYLTVGCDITREEILEIIEEADSIIESHNFDTNTLCRAYLKKAQCLQKLGKYAESKEIVERALEISPEMPEALVRLGTVYNQVEQKYDVAIEYINKALEQNPKYAPGLVTRGNVFLNKGEFDKAFKDFDDAIILKPDYPEAYINRAGIYFYKGEHDRVISDCNEALRFKPDHPIAFVNRGNAYFAKGEFDNAISDYDKAIQLNPNLLLAFYNRGLAYANRDIIDKAIVDFTRAIQLRPDIAYAINDRGIIYGRESKNERAIAVFSIIIQLRPDYMDAVNNRGIVYTNMKKYEQAIADFTRAIQLAPNNASPYFNLGNVYEKIGIYDKAILNFSIGLQKQPSEIEALLRRGNIYANIGDNNRAIADYSEVLRLKPDYANAFFNRGIAYWDKGEHDKALNDYCKALLILIEPKKTPIDSLYFYYLIDLILPEKPDFFWELPIDKLHNIPHFFIEMIVKFRNLNLEKPPYKELIHAVFSLWQSCKNFDNAITVYQYTTLDVLDKMRSNRRLHLQPATYLNDPDEGQVFYKYIVKSLNANNVKIAGIIESLSRTNSEIAVFIRSLTSNKNSLVMWNSSYGDNGNGISVGISAWKINKGQGIDKALISQTQSMQFKNTIQSNDFADNRVIKTKIEDVKSNSMDFMENEHFEEVVPLRKIGLYKILYLDEEDSQNQLKNIADCLLRIGENEYTKEFRELLDELFSSITHLIKDKTYAHEEEYRLLFVDSIKKENKYIKTLVKDGICEGIYVETEPILFQDDKDLVFFGPKVSEVTINKYRHAFRLSDLPLEGSTDKMLQPSGIHYR